MKLYRGLRSAEYLELDSMQIREYQRDWQKILVQREAGNLSYDVGIDPLAKRLKHTIPLTRQYFTDNEAIARQYTESVSGILIQIDVPIADILQYFSLEFQNYSKRKERFEIVYLVDSFTMGKKKTTWNLKVIK